MPYFLNPFTGELDAKGDELGPDTLTQITTDAGTAIPVSNNVNLIGNATQGVSTSAVGDTVTVTVSNAAEAQKGVSELATDAETIAGADSSRTIVPTGLKAKLGAQTNRSIPYGQGSALDFGWTGQLNNGQLVIGSTLGTPDAANLTSSGSTVVYTVGSNTLDLDIANATTTQIGGSALATDTEVKQGTVSTKTLIPSSFSSYMNDLDFTGFVSWSGAGNYFDDTTLGTFQLLRGGTGYIQGKLVTWAPQDITGLTAGNTYYIYIDSTGTIGKTSTRTEQLFTDNIVLFECLRDSTPITNNQVTVKENHPYNYSATVSNYEHDNIGTLIENMANGANITLNGTQKIQINGDDVLSDHGLETTIPDSAGVGVTWIKMYTDGAGKWARQNATDTFTGFWNNAGTPQALTANRFAVYTLYVSKDTLTSSTPTYFAVLDTSEYTTQGAASTAISNGTTAKSSNELAQLELCQLGYIIYRQSTSAIVQVIISKSTLRSTLSTAGTNAASLVNTNTASFNGWLSAANTNVQSSLDTLDDVLIGGTSGQIVASNGAATQPTYTTATYPKTTGAGEMLLSNAANTVTSGASLTGDFTYTSATAGAERSVTITNTDNTNASSAATLKLTTGGANAGDAKTQYSTTTTSWVTGIDNSATAPSADPYVISQGTALGSNNVMVVSTSGEINYPLQSAFLAYLASPDLNQTGNGTPFTLGSVTALTEVFDQNSDFNVNGTFTAPITGRYRFYGQLLAQGLANAISFVGEITTSNRNYLFLKNMVTSSDQSIFAYCLADMDAGDTATFQGNISGMAGNTADIFGSAGGAYTYFSGQLEC